MTETADKLRIFVADDSALVRRGLIGMLSCEEDWEVCGQAENGEETLQKVKELLPALVLLDISMPGMNGLEVARLIRQSVPATRVIMLSQHDADRMLPGALAVGAHGCVDKGRLATDLLPSIRSIACDRSAT